MSGLCEVCREIAHKYKCPRCLLKTCSLACVKQHKAENQCNGERNKTAYTAVKEFTDITLLSDYRFLEDAGRKANEASRDIGHTGAKYPRHVQKFRKQVEKRGISLRTMPYPMSRRKTNGSYFNFQKQFLMWYTEWQFPQADAKYTRKFHEDTTIEKCVDFYLNPEDETKGIDVSLALRPYVKADRADIKVLMKREDTPAHITRYYELPWTSSITDCLQRKVVIEYPTFHVVLRDQWDSYILEDEPAAVEPENSSDVRAEGDTVKILAPKAIYPEGFSRAAKDVEVEESQKLSELTEICEQEMDTLSTEKKVTPQSESETAEMKATHQSESETVKMKATLQSESETTENKETLQSETKKTKATLQSESDTRGDEVTKQTCSNK